MMLQRIFPLLMTAFLIIMSGCGLEFVPVQSHESFRPDADPEMLSYRSLHFVVYGYDSGKNMKTAEIAEDVYKKVMFDTNLMSFKPRENYRITIYRTPEEYRHKTGLPAWSGGGAMTKPLGQVLPEERGDRARTSIVTFESVLSAPLIAHEVTHLIFGEFMAFETSADFGRVLWLNEGLATFEEMEFYGEGSRGDFVQVARSIVKHEVFPISELITFRPMQTIPQNMGRYHFMNQPHDYTNIDLWYWHVQYLTQFLIQREGQYSFYIFLNGLKNGKIFVDALQEAYPGKWRTLGELENEWRQWI